MKKMSKVQGDIALRSVVLPDGIAVKAEKLFEFGSISSFAAETKVTGDEVTTNGIGEIKPDDTFEEKISKIAARVRMVCVPAAIVTFILWILAKNFDNPFKLLLCVLFVVSTSAATAPRSMTKFALRLFQKGEYLEESKFRGALYQAMNAFYDLGKVPTLEALEDYSIFSRNDPYFQKELNGPIVFILVGIIQNFDGIAWLIAMFAGVLILLALVKTEIIYAIELLVVSKPDRKHQEVAIRTIEEAISYVGSIKVEMSQTADVEAIDEMFDKFLKLEDCETCKKKESCSFYRLHQMLKKEIRK